MDGEWTLLHVLWATIIHISVVLNPPQAISIIIGLTKDNTPEERCFISKIVCIIAGGLLFLFAFLGQFILNNVFHVSIEAFQVCGGLFLLTIGLRRLLHKTPEGAANSNSDLTRQEVSNYIITPLATPLLAGPGVIAVILTIHMNLPHAFSYTFVFYGALLITIILLYYSFLLSCKFSKFLKPSVLKVVEKLISVCLICSSTNSILNGIKVFLQNL